MTVDMNWKIAEIWMLGAMLAICAMLYHHTRTVSAAIDRLTARQDATERALPSTVTQEANPVINLDPQRDIERQGELQGYYTPTQMAALLGVSPETVLRRIRSGEMHAEKRGRHYFIRLNEAQ